MFERIIKGLEEGKDTREQITKNGEKGVFVNKSDIAGIAVNAASSLGISENTAKDTVHETGYLEKCMLNKL